MANNKKKNKNAKAKDKRKERGGRLIYPMQTPRGPNKGDGTINNDRQYRSKVLDYLKLKIYDVERNNPYNYVKNSGNQGKQEQIKDTVYLYLPHDLSETYSTSYDKVALGPFGNIAVDAMRAGADVDSVIDSIQKGAEAAKPEVAFSAVSGIFNGAASMFQVGGNLNKNQLAALARGQVFNPYEETVFKGVNYRSHNFTFDMAPRNGKEVQNIQKIITTLREAMLPDLSGADNRWMTIPRFFRVELVRYTPNAFAANLNSTGKLGKPDTLSTLLTFPVNMVLTNMQVNMTPSGQNTTLRDVDYSDVDYGPANYRMTLTFDETAFITRNIYTG